MFSSNSQQGAGNRATTNAESSSKHRHHKHSKKRLKTSHTEAITADALGLQLSEDEL